MFKSLGNNASVFPMPVLMIATYDENGVVDVMNAAWGMNCDPDKLMLCLTGTHKTAKNLRISKACTVAMADRAHLKEADFFGMASGNKMADKFARSGLTAVKSDKVNAPVIAEFPLVMECELAEIVNTENLHAVVGRIVNVAAEESVLDADGKVDVAKLEAFAFDNFRSGYYAMGEKAGQAWDNGNKYMG